MIIQVLKKIKNIINSTGFDIIRYPNDNLEKRISLLNKYKINLVIDVGADIGQYSKLLLKLGYKGKIVSFEPILKSYQKLEQSAKNYPNWQTLNYALGDKEGDSFINVASNEGRSSSIRKMQKNHEEAAPNSIISHQEKITIKRLDDLYKSFFKTNDRVFMKIDTQGFEWNVLNGGAKFCDYVLGLQVEMSFVELYEGQVLFHELKQYIENMGFTLCSIENGFTNPQTGQLLQADGIFYKLK